MDFTFGSLFAGIGGFDLGFEQAGWKCSWQVEKDEFCNAVLKKNWPSVPRFKDVREVGKENLKRVDLVCGGFPCQPWSQAGKRKGATDDRHLWPEMARVVSELRPRWVVGENVVGLFGPQLDACLFDLESEGYTVWPVVLPACAVDAPHRRERIFIFGYADSKKQSNESVNEQVAELQGMEEQSPTVADSSRKLFNRSGKARSKGWTKPSDGGNDVADPDSSGLERWDSGELRERSSERTTGESSPPESETPSIWEPEPSVGRVANGVSRRVDRLKSLGNAVVPAVARAIAETINQVEQDSTNRRSRY